VTISLSALAVRAVVLDIEGTTTPVSFVYDVLFPFARRHAEAFLTREWNSDDRRVVVDLLAGDHAAEEARGESPPPLNPSDCTPAQAAAFANWLSDRDRKSPGLKALQGLVWQDGYSSGELRGQVYADVAPALARWRASERDVYIYSSGSILAQQLLFRSTDAGDLTRLLSGYFDTGVGAKTDPNSYRSIVNRLAAPPASLLFVSDVAAELDAARQAGLHTALCVREGAGAADVRGAHPFVRTFDEIVG
jgi:enolase-phosphatase E1